MIELIDVYRDGLPYSDDMEFLYRLLAERKVSESISHKRHPSFEEHKRFMQLQPYRGWYIISDSDGYLGTCYITMYREVGIWLMPEAKGKGAGKAAMKQLLAMYPGRVFTNTAIYNDGAKAFYEKMGFRHCANMLENDNAGSSDSTGKAEQHKASEESLDGNWGDAGPGMDVTSGEDCQEC